MAWTFFLIGAAMLAVSMALDFKGGPRLRAFAFTLSAAALAFLMVAAIIYFAVTL